MTARRDEFLCPLRGRILMMRDDFPRVALRSPSGELRSTRGYSLPPRRGGLKAFHELRYGYSLPPRRGGLEAFHELRYGYSPSPRRGGIEAEGLKDLRSIGAQPRR